MSGAWFQVNLDAPGGVNESAAAIREALANATSTVASTQLDAARFITEHGHDVVNGHADVGEVRQHDIGSDPDTYGPDASDQ